MSCKECRLFLSNVSNALSLPSTCARLERKQVWRSLRLKTKHPSRKFFKVCEANTFALDAGFIYTGGAQRQVGMRYVRGSNSGDPDETNHANG